MLNAILILAALPVWLDELVALVLMAFGGTLVLLVGLVVRRVLRKLGIEETAGLEKLLMDRARVVVRETEEWAKREKDTPNGGDKYARALEAFLEYDEPLQLTDTLRSKSEAFIHAALSEDRGEPSVHAALSEELEPSEE